MVRPSRPAVVCPSCGRETDRAPHYCESCGYDYWRAASRDERIAAAPQAAAGRAGGLSHSFLVGVGSAGLVVALAIAFMWLGGPGAVVGLVQNALRSPRPEVAITRPSRGPEEVVISRFFREVRSEFASFRVVSTSQLRSVVPPGPPEVVRETKLLDGRDWSAYITLEATGDDAPAPPEAWIVEIDGEARARDGADGEWYPVDRTDRSANPFARISTVNEVTYVDEEIVDGEELHHLLVTKWLGVTTDDLRFVGFGALSDRENEFHVWVADDGVPVRARWTATFGVLRGGLEVTLEADTEMTFHDWGQVDAIEFPEPGDQDGPTAGARYNPASHASAARGADSPHAHDRTEAAPPPIEGRSQDQREAA